MARKQPRVSLLPATIRDVILPGADCQIPALLAPITWEIPDKGCSAFQDVPCHPGRPVKVCARAGTGRNSEHNNPAFRVNSRKNAFQKEILDHSMN